jgi:hypothetical protein
MYQEFSERQTIRDPGLMMIIISTGLISTGLVAFLTYKEFTEGDNMTESMVALTVVILVQVLVFLLIFRSPMDTLGGQEGFQFRYRPFQWNWRHLAWADIQSWQIRKVEPFREFGGWGYRRALFKKKTGLITGSGKGIELVLQNGYTWVLTTQNPEMLAVLCRKYAANKEKTV